MVKFLISKGADVNDRNDNGATPLMLAAMRGNKESVELLAAKGADVNVKANKGETALHLAAISGHRRTWWSFLSAGEQKSMLRPNTAGQCCTGRHVATMRM